jgi:hypothetical protein
MPTLKEVLLKIQGIKKTKQITKAMNMVATPGCVAPNRQWSRSARMPLNSPKCWAAWRKMPAKKPAPC